MIQTYTLDFLDKKKRLFFKINDKITITLMDKNQKETLDLVLNDFRDLILKFKKTFMERLGGLSIHLLNDKVIFRVNDMQINLKESVFNQFIDTLSIIILKEIACRIEKN